jgi:hypothetical protein
MRPIITRLGEDVTYTPAGGEPAAVRALFIAPYYRALDLVPSSQPRLAIMSADVPQLAIADLVSVRSTGYEVVEVEPNEVSGVVVAVLQVA